MKDLFQELYNKVLSLFNSTKIEADPTKNVAINRLKTVLMQDRAGFSESAIQLLKEELISVVSKYMEIETEDFELQIDAADEQKTVLNLTIPVIRPKTDEEIDTAIMEQKEAVNKKVVEIVKELETIIKQRTKEAAEDEIDFKLIQEAANKVNTADKQPENGLQPEKDKENNPIQETKDEEKDFKDAKISAKTDTAGV